MPSHAVGMSGLADGGLAAQGSSGGTGSKLKGMAAKVIDKTTAALEGAKHKVTKHRTAPAAEE